MEETSTNDEPYWLGLPLKTKCSGEVYYSTIRIRGHKYSIGDCAYFVPNSEDQSPYIGQITKLWQDVNRPLDLDDKKSHGMMVKCIWYFYPEDTHTGRTKKHHKRELFLSDLSDVNGVDSITSSVEVLSYEEFNQKLASLSKSDLKRIFFCRSFYNEHKKEFTPFKLESNGHVFIDIWPKVVPTNWPSDLLYTRNTVWRVSERYRDYFQSMIDCQVAIGHVTEEDSNDGSRTGLFATKDIPSGTILGEYTGYIGLRSLPEDDDVDDDKGARFIQVLYHDEEVKAVIDSNVAGNEFRFLRACSGDQVPNVKTVPIWTAAKWHLIVFTIRDIKLGEELLKPNSDPPQRT